MSTSQKPTLLAFHGSGSNATVHTVQLARLSRFLKPHFNIICLEAPFPSPPGPGILPFFTGCGPFYRWLPPSQAVSLDVMRWGTSSSCMSSEVEDLIKSTVLRIRSQGGRVVGLIGFSQGTKIVAGLLRASEVGGQEWCRFDFALSVCASYPPPLFPGCVGEEEKEGKIQVPTFHVQGAKDEWNWAGKGMIEKYYQVGEGSESVEWDMGHHYPVAVEESERIAEWMVEAWRRAEEGRKAS